MSYCQNQNIFLQKYLGNFSVELLYFQSFHFPLYCYQSYINLLILFVKVKLFFKLFFVFFVVISFVNFFFTIITKEKAVYFNTTFFTYYFINHTIIYEQKMTMSSKNFKKTSNNYIKI